MIISFLLLVSAVSHIFVNLNARSLLIWFMPFCCRFIEQSSAHFSSFIFYREISSASDNSCVSRRQPSALQYRKFAEVLMMKLLVFTVFTTIVTLYWRNIYIWWVFFVFAILSELYCGLCDSTSEALIILYIHLYNAFDYCYRKMWCLYIAEWWVFPNILGLQRLNDRLYLCKSNIHS